MGASAGVRLAGCPGGEGGVGVQAVFPGPTPASLQAVGSSDGLQQCHTLALREPSPRLGLARRRLYHP